MDAPAPPPISADLITMVVAVTNGSPRVLTLAGDALPAGPLTPGHRSLQTGVRTWVEQQTHHPLGYVEQLYTFADHGRRAADGPQTISISYLGLTREAATAAPAGWRTWYEYFPWEDRRSTAADASLAAIHTRLAAWASSDPASQAQRRRRTAICFGTQPSTAWNEELVLQRYELLHEAGLVPEAQPGTAALLGRPMVHDHRRILATGIARLRAKIKYRPVVFELLPGTFTLLDLQHTVEALAGQVLHKPNFRRLIAQQALVEETGQTTTDTPGRPAKLFRFRRDILLERSVAGTKLPLARTT